MRVAALLATGLMFWTVGAHAEENTTADPNWREIGKCGPWEGVKPTRDDVQMALNVHQDFLESFPDQKVPSELTDEQQLGLHKRANFCRANLKGADLQGADLQSAKLQGADLQGANLQRTQLVETDLKGAQLSRADLRGAFLNRAKLANAKLWSANLSEASLNGAELTDASLKDANLEFAKLRYASLHRANFTRANLEGADLQDANLGAAILQDSLMGGVNISGTILTHSVYAPRTLPISSAVPNTAGIASIKFGTNQDSGVAQLRATFQKAGLRDAERAATYALKKNQIRNLWRRTPGEGADFQDLNPQERVFNSLVAAFSYVFFELSCKYGLAHIRPIGILLGLIVVFMFPYMISVANRSSTRSGIWREWPGNRLIHDDAPRTGTIGVPAQVTPERITARGRYICLWGFYFSVLSALHIGWRDLNVGSWISRMQPREYTLRAAGWVRVVSGIQSLISVYLIALWALTTFGRPFG